MRRSQALRAWIAASILLAGAWPALATEGAAADGAFSPTWERSKSIKEASQRIAVMHRAKGPRAVYQFIDACYRTHGLASKYGEALESCFVQDYLETKMLVQIYSQMAPETRSQIGLASPEDLVGAMNGRMAAALKTYELPHEHAEELMRLVDAEGLPVFLAIVFPEALKARQKDQEKKPEKK